MRRVDHADAGIDPELLEVLYVRRDHPFKCRLESQELERERFAIGIDANAVLDGVVGLVEKLAGLQQEIAVIACAVAYGRNIDRAERPLWNGNAEARQERALCF